MAPSNEYDLKDFTPYLLNLAAETSSLRFQKHYKARYGILRSEWRVLFHLGRYGDMTAKEICDRARLHKTKVSRAVSALETKRFLTREVQENDRRHATLSLTKAGLAAYQDLVAISQQFDIELMADFSDDEKAVLRKCLTKLAGI